MLRQDEDSMKKVYDRHKDADKNILFKKNLKDALADVGLLIQGEELEGLLASIDTEDSSALDYNEFKRASMRPSKVQRDLESWTASIPFGELFAAAFCAVADRTAAKKDPLRAISKCSDDDLAVIFEGLSEGILTLFKQHGRQLREAYDVLDKKKLSPSSADDQSKFTVNPMSCGSISAFYDGLGSRVGKVPASPSSKMPAAYKLPFCRLPQPTVHGGDGEGTQEQGKVYDAELWHLHQCGGRVAHCD